MYKFYTIYSIFFLYRSFKYEDDETGDMQRWTVSVSLIIFNMKLKISDV